MLNIGHIFLILGPHIPFITKTKLGLQEFQDNQEKTYMQVVYVIPWIHT